MEVFKFIMEHEWLNKDNITNQLKALNAETNRFETIVEYLFNDCIVDLMDNYDLKYSSELGHPAYPSLQILGLLLFAEEEGLSDFQQVHEKCLTDDKFKILAPYDAPSRNTLSKFLNCEKEDLFTCIFLYSLVKMNDYHFFDNLEDHYLDSTDGLSGGSINYLITEDEIDALKLLKKWDLIHDRSERQIKKTKFKLKRKLSYYKNHPDYTRLIGLALKRIKLYNDDVYAKIDEFDRALEKNDNNYVSVTFPEAIKVPTKRGKWDIGFNLQIVMTSNHVVLSSLLSNKPNDSSVLPDIEKVLLKNKELLVELQTDYGERWNYDYLEKLFDKSKYWCDAGYDGEENNKFIQTSKLNFIVLPRKQARQINNQLRNKNNNASSKKKNRKKRKCLKNEDDYSISDCVRVENGYICPFGRFIELIEVIYRKNDKKNKESDLPSVLKNHDFIHKCSDCSGCPYLMKHGEPCSVANLKEKTTIHHYELTNKFASGEYDDAYSKRFPISEGINGYLKRRHGTLILLGHNHNMAQNHSLLKLLLYNLKRFVKLKGTVC